MQAINPVQLIQIEVVYADASWQKLLKLQVPVGTTALEAVEKSQIKQIFPDLELARCDLGIFGQVCAPNRVLVAGDRVEIYRPLICDPVQMRRARAKKRR